MITRYALRYFTRILQSAAIGAAAAGAIIIPGTIIYGLLEEFTINEIAINIVYNFSGVFLIVFTVFVVVLMSIVLKLCRKHNITFDRLGRLSPDEMEQYWLSKGEPPIDRTKPWWKRHDEE